MIVARWVFAAGIVGTIDASTTHNPSTPCAAPPASTTAPGSASPAGASGWFAALNDPVVARALQLLHHEPTVRWTVDAIARRIGASRTVLDERFKTLLDRPPIDDLAAWRIQLAAERLRATAQSVPQVAASVGYDSGAAFGRAFERFTGMSPGRWRDTPGRGHLPPRGDLSWRARKPARAPDDERRARPVAHGDPCRTGCDRWSQVAGSGRPVRRSCSPAQAGCRRRGRKGIVMVELYERELLRAGGASGSGAFEDGFGHLERAPVPSQKASGRPAGLHWLMRVARPSGALREKARAMTRVLVAAALATLCAVPGHAQPLSLASTQLPQADGGRTTVFYPTRAPESPVAVGPFHLSWAQDAPPEKGNGRLVVISHGSGGSPWVHVDLARTLVGRGFVVAIPQHAGDNYQDPSSPGPESWVKRPREVSDAIDRIAGDPRLSPLVSLDAVGVFGGSAGGHTALSLVGGEWSPARFRDHCLQHVEEDFSSCVGFKTLLRGDGLDGLKVWLARRVIAWRFSDDTVQRYVDPRVKAAVAMVPFAADFDPRSLAEPRIPLGLVVAAKDVNQIPAFHVEAVLKACEPRCQLVMTLPEGGHGAMLSPLPPLEKGSIADRLLGDPLAFDRADALPRLNARIAEFFEKALPGP